MNVRIAKNEAENLYIAKSILEEYPSKRIYTFTGELGAGKTTLIKSFCQVLGVTDPVSSPTFALIQVYRGLQAEIYHCDFYRLQREEDAYEIGVDEYLYSGAYCFIEWPIKIASLLPDDHLAVYIRIREDQSRSIEYG